MWLTVTSESAPATEVVRVDADAFVIGRERTCDLVLDDEKASRQHCRLSRLPNGDMELADLGSTNGTRLDGSLLSAPVVLRGGEQIRIGRHTIAVSRTEPGTGAGTVIDTSGSVVLAAASPSPALPGLAFPPAPLAPPAAALTGGGSKPKKSKVPLVVAGVVAAAVVAGGLVVVTGRSSSLSTQDIISRSKPRTVSVESDVDGQLRGRGTGWVLDAKRGLIVTNQHVVNAGASFTVGLDGGKRPATIVGGSPCEDLAVLKVNDVSGLETMPLSSQANMKQGDKVIAVGYPGNPAPKPELQANAGIVSVVKTSFTAEALDVPKLSNIVQTDAAINPGNSGGPLLDTKGRLVGVNSAGDSSKENQAFAIGVDRVKEITAQLAEGGSRGWTGLGLKFPTRKSDFEDRDLPVIDGGIIADFAVPLTPAANLGLAHKQFVIVGINGNRLEGTMQSYCAQVATLKAGDKATFNVTLDGRKVLDVPIEFA